MADANKSKDTEIASSKPDDGHKTDIGTEPDAEVHSANAWEKADMGDTERKNKFLRLMGAGKKEHHGRFVIGDKNPDHARNRGQADRLEHDLEDQFDQSMQHRLAGGRRGHIGLGYHDDHKDTDASEVKDTGDASVAAEAKGGEDRDANKDVRDNKDDNTKDDDVKDDKTVDDEKDEKRSRKRESAEISAKVEDSASVEKKMKFVKSSH